MSESSFKLEFYLIKISTNQYNLFNTATDKLILKEGSKVEVVEFLEHNLPTHPFLYQTNQEHNNFLINLSEEDLSRYAASADSYTLTSVSFYNPQFNYDSYPEEYDCDFNVFNYDYAADTYHNKDYVGEEEYNGYHPPSQLEFNFTYKDKEIIKPVVDVPTEDEEYPYLPEDTDIF